ncbi:TPA: reverse transcriptase domain-containing protein [Aeromonas veronii]
MNKISNDFFKKAILKDELLLDSFSPSVTEHHVSDDFFFVIKEKTPHKSINKRITNLVLSQLPLNSSACGFIKGKSYYDFLSPHITGYYYLRLDIKHFFHSIDENHVFTLLESIFSKDKEKFKNSPFDLALSAVTHQVSKNNESEEIKGRRILPIGFSSSPMISNIIFRPVDILIQKFCEDKRITYSRYADDLLFSSPDNKFLHSEQFEKEISILIGTLKLKLNKKKRISCENTISLNGYVIQNTKNKKTRFFNVYKEEPIGNIRLSNKKLKTIKQLIYLLGRKTDAVTIMANIFNVHFSAHKFKYHKSIKFFKQYAEDQLQNKIKGYRSYLLSIVTYNKNNPCVSTQDIEKYLSLVESLNIYIK